jgi:hypothetical protein
MVYKQCGEIIQTQAFAILFPSQPGSLSQWGCSIRFYVPSLLAPGEAALIDCLENAVLTHNLVLVPLSSDMIAVRTSRLVSQSWTVLIFSLLGVVSSILTMDKWLEHFDNPGPSLQGAFVSVFPGGCFFGAALAGYLGDRIGRKRTIQVRIPIQQ